MASKYDDLDASTELEQELAADLRRAYEVRGCEVVHHGANSGGTHSPGGKPDIELRDLGNGRLVLIEVTKRKSSAADGEFIAIIDHLQRAIDAGGYISYDMFYVSPATSPRMSTNLRDLWNRTRERDGKSGRIVALDFAGMEMMLRKLWESDAALYPAERLGELFGRWAEASDDARARQLVQATLFPEDFGLAHDLANEAEEVDAEHEKRLKKQLERIEEKLRDLGITGNEANVTLVHLAFIRLYEERRQHRTGEFNRFTREGFTKWRETLAQQLRDKHPNRLIQVLLQEIAEDADLKAAGLLRDGSGNVTQLKPEVTDARVENLILKVLDQYDFHAGRLAVTGSGHIRAGRLDVLGAVFETLARRSEKDTRVGQFFTPQQVVDFCADLVQVRPGDVVLDPAVGTARFLIAAMQRMLANADESSLPLADAQASIRARQLLGTDIDDWVATIAKMNMFIHGDGKSNISRVNGLVLGDSPVFDAYPSGLEDGVDVVLTNPPLGDTSFLVAGENWAELAYDRDGEGEIDFLRRLRVVPVRSKGETEVARWKTKLAESDKRIAELQRMSPEEVGRKLAGAYTTRNNRARRVAELETAIAAGALTWEAQGEDLKGGALFLGAVAQYLKLNRDPDRTIEWRGGHAAIVVDEAILNTPDYGSTREFIREHFYVKAVISLSRDAFKYLAHTDAKTSILFLTRKPQPGVRQREPIFFGHADRVGYSATGAWVGDDLPQVLVHYRIFQRAVADSHSGAHLDPDAAMDAVRALPGFANAFFARIDPGEGLDRLDFYDARFKQRVSELAATHGELLTLADVLEVHDGAAPAPARNGAYPFAYVAREGEVRPKGVAETDYPPSKLWVVTEGDLVVSGIDLVWGAVGVARGDTAGMVMSSEMHAYRVRQGVEAVPEFLLLILRTRTANEMLWGLTTGTSNRTRLESGAQLLALPIPPLPPLAEQRRQADELNEILRLRREAAERLAAAHDAVQETWQAEPLVVLPDPREMPLVDAQLVS
jgi:type I restriction-modification system DNA methylase subunit